VIVTLVANSIFDWFAFRNLDTLYSLLTQGGVSLASLVVLFPISGAIGAIVSAYALVKFVRSQTEIPPLGMILTRPRIGLLVEFSAGLTLLVYGIVGVSLVVNALTKCQYCVWTAEQDELVILVHLFVIFGAILSVDGTWHWFKRDNGLRTRAQDENGVTGKHQGLERIDGVHAYLFFPIGTPKENLTLDYHNRNLKHRLIVNHKTTPPEPFFLTTDSFGWALINKFTDLWSTQNDPSPYDDGFTERWCKEKGWTLNPFNASKDALTRTSSSSTQSSSL
jgi:hypothetical protein